MDNHHFCFRVMFAHASRDGHGTTGHGHGHSNVNPYGVNWLRGSLRYHIYWIMTATPRLRRHGYGQAAHQSHHHFW
jgi:hypothetical protein